MSQAFRDLLRKIGSGPHTSKDLTRQESAAATEMMLTGVATPAQIGGFLIAHRIKRPTAAELAGMLDAFDHLGPRLAAVDSYERPVMVFGIPYDGRSRTTPLGPLTALILAAAGQPVLQHGGDQMPTKYGLHLAAVWRGLGVAWENLSLEQAQVALAQTGISFVHLRTHFPLAQEMVTYREQIGKRPPFATLELCWCPYAGPARVVSGFVHPPTEALIRETLQLRHGPNPPSYLMVKGLEGSCDLPRERVVIAAAGEPFERLLLTPRDFELAGNDPPLHSPAQVQTDLLAVLAGEAGPLLDSAAWNGGFYLWQSGLAKDMQAGLTLATSLLSEGHALAKLEELRVFTAEAVSGETPVALIPS
ncbi:anthranilate phosphoribosyltransferase family protein [Leptolyngbya sp. FACHB-261]|uniref:anthranilate phosphoribosyltransferase family protein n=1 Tax=Leptolyngbya sp. FACHB-261 TaxID=2692806 RepID=UPI0016835989|nr:anthranilate phosphoribosyltransferase family protein [Leptolyngbya sp. FACHB-261]MBD2101865.1 anthranilate phosphoribosyltransferase family protein [Leptolyngbya sp. FACHB-261]